jgi:predicted CoA-binding protein
MSPCPSKQRAADGEPPRPVAADRPSDEVLAGILTGARTIAVVGMSDTEGKAARSIPLTLIERGWNVVPVNPNHATVAGRTSYATLADVPVPIDLVNVFRPAAETAEIARQAAAVGASGVWLQAGIRSDEARQLAEAAGMTFVHDACTGACVRRMDLRAAD